MSSHRRGPWSPPEDAYLVSLVHTQGPLNWVRIAQLIGTRSPKQCRERYHQNLKPTLNHEPISPEEGLQIERLVGEMGKRWAEIARRLHGRSDNAVKNWWNGSMNRRKRMNHRKKTSPQCLEINTFSERNETLSFTRPATSAERNGSYASSTSFSSRRTHAPLPSPSVSETSRAESVDGAPSLISDSGSAFSISPRVAASPTLELPPLSVFGRMDSRRASLPLLQFQSRSSFEGDPHIHYPFSPRFPSESKTNSSLPPPMPRPNEMFYSIPLSPTNLHYGHNNNRHRGSQSLTAPSTPVHLPPLNIMTSRPEASPERDSRMHLSSLLG